ncbi:MAG: DMT family transporter [Burkholderiales bacterium]
MAELSEADPRARTLAIIALLAGATCIGTSALFVKVSEAGPVSTAFWRVFLALPFLWAWAWWDRQRTAGAPSKITQGGSRKLLFATGFFFAGDLAVWHWSIVLTSVANAVLLANLAPIFVTLAAWWLWRKKPAAMFLAGLAAALIGVMLMVGGDFSNSSGRALLGDALGVVTAMFYAAYQLTVTRLRGTVSTARIMAVSSVVTAAFLLPVAWLSGEVFFPVTEIGWAKVLGLAVISQVAGQSLIAYAMAHLPATLSSVGLLLQPVMASLFAWILLGETLGAVAIAGAALVLIGIRIATQAENKP